MDADGWVYGDNKWENTGARGGLGKVSPQIKACFKRHAKGLQFTRRRRWQRRAICSETVQRLPSDPETSLPVNGLKGTPIRAAISEVRVEPIVHASETEGTVIPPVSPARDDVLRSRLKKAMGSVGG